MRLIAAQDSLDTGRQLLHIERLDHEIIRAQLQSENLVKDLALCRYHDNRLCGYFAYLAADLPAILLRQHQIQQHKIRLILLEGIYAFHAVSHGLDIIALIFEIYFQQVTDVGVVVHNQDFRIHHVFFLPFLYSVPAPPMGIHTVSYSRNGVSM